MMKWLRTALSVALLFTAGYLGSAEITDLDTTDANNTARWPEGMAASTVNDSARALEGLLARGFTDALESDLTSAGSSNAYTLTPNRTVSAYYQGLRFVFIANHSNTGASTLNVSALGAKNIYKPTSSGPAAVENGDIVANQLVDVIYDGTQFVLLSPTPITTSATYADTTVANTFTAEPQTIQDTDSGATANPNLVLDRDSPSPADNDVLGSLDFLGEDSGGGDETYATIQGEIVDATAATEDGQINFQTVVGGSISDAFHIGAGAYCDGATGGDQGADTLNCSDFYDDGTNISSIYQATNAILDDLSGLTQATDKVPYFDSATTAATLDFLDEDNMASDSASAVASQQSIKAYVDASYSNNPQAAIDLTNGGANDLTEVEITGLSNVQAIEGWIINASSSGTEDWFFLVGDSGGYHTTGYDHNVGGPEGTPEDETTGYQINNAAIVIAAAGEYRIWFRLVRMASNVYAFTSKMWHESSSTFDVSAGVVTLDTALTQFKFKTASADTFDSGTGYWTVYGN